MVKRLDIKQVEWPTKDGITLRGDAWGDPDWKPILLLHGGAQTRHAWDKTAWLLADKGFYAVTLDLRGHGESDWSKDGSYDLDIMVSDVSKVLQGLNVNAKAKPVLVGASLGGIISLTLLGEFDAQAARAVVLVDIAPRVEPKGVERIITFMDKHRDGFDDLDQAADAVAKYVSHRSRPTDLSGLRKNLRKRADGRYYWHWDPILIEKFAEAKAVDEARLKVAASSLKMPVLLVRGLMSDVVSSDIAREFLALVPSATYVDVPGAGHMVAGDSNDAFSEALITFVESL